jgi:hypothetical protein
MTYSNLDKFYTSPKLANELLSAVDINSFGTVVEPSAGNGAVSKLINNCIAYDISPDDDSIIKQDYLKIHTQFKCKTLVIGNPPFGKAGKLAKQFINHSFKLGANTVAFILPKAATLGIKHKLIYYKEIQSALFYDDGKDFIIDVVIAVYSVDGVPIKRNSSRQRNSKYYVSGKYNKDANLVVRGVRPKILYDINVFSRISKDTKYYSIQFFDDDLLKKFKKYKFDNSAAFPYTCISKLEDILDDLQ